MSIWVVVGGQYGSEGKGKIAAYLAKHENADFCVRCGGPNSGHSITSENGNIDIFRQIPTGVITHTQRLLIAAGALIDLKILKEEIDKYHLSPNRLGVDHNCFVIDDEDRKTEQTLQLQDRIGSTLTGVGAAASRRVLRATNGKTAKMASHAIPWLKSFITNVAEELNQGVNENKNIIIEGTQGYGLSLYHSGHFPHCTSRDTTAAAFLSETGLSPTLSIKVMLVLRTFPIRVPGNSGPLANEINWNLIQQESGYPNTIAEMTSVTKRFRRVARFDWELAKQATWYNRPSAIALNGIDLLNYKDHHAKSYQEISELSIQFISKIETELKTMVTLIGSGPEFDKIISIQNKNINQNQKAS